MVKLFTTVFQAIMPNTQLINDMQKTVSYISSITCQVKSETQTLPLDKECPDVGESGRKPVNGISL